MKIAFFLPSLGGGGAEKMMTILANNIVQRGFSVDFVLAHASGPFLEAVSPRIRIIDFGAASTFRSLPRLTRYLRKERPDAMLASLSHANVVALLAKRLSCVSTRLVVREACTQAHLEAGKRVVALMRLTYGWADAVVAISDGVRDDLAARTGLPPKRILRIYNPAITKDFDAKCSEAIHHEWFRPGSPPVVLGVGRLAPQKDFDTLIKAFAAVRARRPARLMILGEGGDRRKLEALSNLLGIQGDVELAGYVGNPYPYMRSSAVFVLSSRYEGFGNVLVEAMACGIPVVSTDCPSGPREILEEGRWGPLVPVGDWESLSQAIDSQLDVGISIGQILSVQKRFYEDHITERYLQTLLGK